LALYMHLTRRGERDVGLYSLLMLALDEDGHLHTQQLTTPHYPLNRMLVGPQSPTGPLEKQNNFYPCQEVN